MMKPTPRARTRSSKRTAGCSRRWRIAPGWGAVIWALALGAWPTLAWGVGRYPDIVLTHSFRPCIAINRGERRLREEWTINGFPVHTTVELCAVGGRAFGDIDGDGRLDEITEEGIQLGHGDGRFGIRTVAFIHQNSSMAFASADLDRDGYADVLMGTFGIRVFFGRPDGTLRGGEELPLLGDEMPRFAAGDVYPMLKLVDIDGDGFEDLMGASNAGPLLAWGRGDGTFEFEKTDAATFIMRAKLCDFNEDGFLDIVRTGRISTFGFNGFIGLCVNLGKQRGFVSPTEIIPIEGLDYWNDFPAGVAVGDFNRDGHTDVMTGGGFGWLAVFLGHGDGTFEPQIREPLPLNDWATAVLFEDLDLDGAGDLVVSYWHLWTFVYWGVEDGFVDYENPTEIKDRSVFDLSTITGIHRAFVRGDADDNGAVNLTDAVTVLQQLFAGRAMVCGDASDTNDDGEFNLTDAVYLLEHLFRGGSAPPYPYPAPAGDPTGDVGWNGHYGGDLGCSFETFNYETVGYVPCESDEDPANCVPPRRPIRQFIDVSVPP